jgi:hypothetical protein
LAVLLKRRKKLHLILGDDNKKGLGFGKTEVAGPVGFRELQTASKTRILPCAFWHRQLEIGASSFARGCGTPCSRF